MRPTVRCLQLNLERLASQRHKSTSFIGLGRMGYEMAFNLFSKQHALASDSHFVVCDAVPSSAARFRDAFMEQCPGAQLEVARDPGEATLASQTIITMLPASPQVLDVYHTGILPALRTLPREAAAATFCIDSTTLDVAVARQISSEVSNLLPSTTKGPQMVDAPVSGGVTGAKAGTLSFLVGGEADAFARAKPILELMGKRVIHCGPAGAGLAAKICNNLVLGVQQIVTAEAMLLGQKLGLDPAVLAAVIGSSTGSCWSVNVNNPVPGALPDKAPPCERAYEGGFATALMLKDMGLATTVAQQTSTPTPLGEAASAIYAKVVAEKPELAGKDFSAVYEWLREEGKEKV
uniref:3-hydroxyisobutyrate dehydrogenase n=1 Tax=Schizophyllum commune (strain H4-8 / FGSC 9210) TaxID=578458 RepID=D8PVZ3_SCHCM